MDRLYGELKLQEKARAEGHAEGRAEGRAQGYNLRLVSQVRKKISKGKACGLIAEELEETNDYIRLIYNIIVNNPDAEDETVYELLSQIENKL